jgi:penicillin-binding protein 2
MRIGGELRDRELEFTRFRARVAFTALCMFVGLVVIAGRFAWLQIAKQEHFQALAESNRISTVPVVPKRGLILDRNGKVLANNTSAFTLEITPSQVGDLDAAIDRLATVVEVNPRDRRRFKRLMEESKNFESLPIRSRLSEEEVARFSVNRFRFPGVEIKARPFRHYPYEQIASHALGHIGRINEGELKRLETAGQLADYKGTDHIGKLGIEASYETVLHGTAGSEDVEVDAAGRAMRSLTRREPTSGDDLFLTLDIELQKVAEEAFENWRGALIAIEPKTGDVLALVSKPNFDPNLFVDGIDPQNWDLLNNSPDKPMNNRALRGVYPPGSTIKPFMALAGLAYGLRTPQFSIADPGYFTLPGVNHRWRDWKVGGHGIVDLRRSIAISCDTYYYGLGNEMGIERLHDFMVQFGFGDKTGIDIDGELPGLQPSPAWKQRRFKQKWYAGDTISVSIGQGYWLATPMQLATATAALANDGVLVRPHLVRAIRDAKSGVTNVVARKEQMPRVPLSKEHLAVVKQGMVDVTIAGGTAYKSFANAGYVVAGKTGTAQVKAIKQGERYDASKIDARFHDHALFVAYAPADNPKLALAILVENGGGGSTTAAPMAREVFDFFLLGKRTRLKKSVEGEAEEAD